VQTKSKGSGANHIVAGLLLSLAGILLVVGVLLLLPVNALSSLGSLAVPYLAPWFYIGVATLIAGVVLLLWGIAQRARHRKH
jgi:hypothetical protein